jgi:hypothetical protein
MSIETWNPPPQNGAALARHDPQPTTQPAPVVALMEWAQSAQAAHSVAESLVTTSFVPAAFRGRPAEATAAILSGLEVGLSPMAALRAFDIIQGTAAPRAITLRAVVQSRGHQVWVEESTATRAIVKGKRAGSAHVQESVWTIDRARGLGLLGKDNWKKQPGAMLVARATAELCRLIASDAILGLPYTAEELDDGGIMEAPEQPAPAVATPARRTAQRRTPPKAPAAPSPAAVEVDEPTGPPLPGEDGYDEPPEPPPAGGDADLSRKQLARIQTFFSANGIKDRDFRLQVSSLIVGHELTSANDLKIAEASTLIDTLDRIATQNPGEVADALRVLVDEAENRTEEPS